MDTGRGELYGKPFPLLTKKEFVAEIRHQLLKSQLLNDLIEKINQRPLSSYNFAIEVWPDWQFPPSVSEVSDPYPKWVNNVENQQCLPEMRTSIPNLFLAGAYTQTATDLYSMEAAVESGKHVADLLSGETTVISPFLPGWLAVIQEGDKYLYVKGFPHILQVVVILVVVILVVSYCLKMR